MGTGRALLVLVAIPGVVVAQQAPAAAANVAILLPCSGLARFDEAFAQEPAASRAAASRFSVVLSIVLAGEPAVSFMQAGGRPGTEILIVKGSGEQVAAASKAVEQLRKDEPLRMRLQCSWATVPKAVAEAQGLKLRGVEAAVADEKAVNTILREAAKGKGGLVNLPEVVAGPLAPFVVEPAGKAAAATAPEQTLRLRGEMVPLSETEVGVALHLVRGALPADKTVAPPGTLKTLALQLQSGKTAMAIALTEGDTATVLIVRCIELAPAPLAKSAPR